MTKWPTAVPSSATEPLRRTRETFLLPCSGKEIRIFVTKLRCSAMKEEVAMNRDIHPAVDRDDSALVQAVQQGDLDAFEP